MNIVIKRLKKYNPIGRNQTQKEAKSLDKEIITMLKNRGLQYNLIDGDKDAPKNILDLIKNG